MHRIDFWGRTPKDVFLKLILQNKIQSVLKRILETDSDIHWFIFDMYNAPIMTESEKLISNISKDYLGRNCLYKIIAEKNICKGFASPPCKSIWIYEGAIRTSISLFDSPFNSIFKPSRSDELADIIMDEIAHIRTCQNHGETLYDKKLQNYRRLFYKFS